MTHAFSRFPSIYTFPLISGMSSQYFLSEVFLIFKCPACLLWFCHCSFLPHQFVTSYRRDTGGFLEGWGHFDTTQLSWLSAHYSAHAFQSVTETVTKQHVALFYNYFIHLFSLYWCQRHTISLEKTVKIAEGLLIALKTSNLIVN